MIRIITNSTSSLSKEMQSKYGIKIASLSFEFNGESINECDTSMTVQELLDEIAAGGKMGPLKPPTTEQYEALYKDSVANGDEEIIVVAMSSNANDSYNNAVKAAESFLDSLRIEGIRIAIIDSRSLFFGFGYLTAKMAIMRNAGASFDKLIDFAEVYKNVLRRYVAVNDAMVLAQQGYMKVNKRKLNQSSDEITILSAGKNSKGIVVGQSSSLDGACKILSDDFAEERNTDMDDFIMLTYSTDKARAETLREHIIKSEASSGEVCITQMSLSTAAAMGRDTVGLAYIGSESYSNFFDRSNPLVLESHKQNY